MLLQSVIATQFKAKLVVAGALTTTTKEDPNIHLAQRYFPPIVIYNSQAFDPTANSNKIVLGVVFAINVIYNPNVDVLKAFTVFVVVGIGL